MQLQINVTDKDGVTETLVAYPADFVAWERHTKRKLSDFANGGVGMEDLAYLAWSASRRKGGERPPFDVWLDRLTDLEEADDQDEPTPTQPAASAGSSSS